MLPILKAKSGVPGVSWPAIPGPVAANLLALQFQLDRTQHWPAAVLQAHQLAQLKTLLDFCRRTVSFYRDRPSPPGGPSDGELTMWQWRRLPLLTRRDVQEAGRRLYSTAPPKAHGGISTVRTSGSTGTPVEAVRTDLAQFYRMAVGLRFVLYCGTIWTLPPTSRCCAVTATRRPIPSMGAAFRTGRRRLPWHSSPAPAP